MENDGEKPKKQKKKEIKNPEGSPKKKEKMKEEQKTDKDGGQKKKKKTQKMELDPEHEGDQPGPSSSSSHPRDHFLRNLPQTKVRTIMDSSPNAAGLKLSGEALFTMTRAAEAFVEMLARGAHQWPTDSGAPRARIAYNDLAQYVHANEPLNFIQDILPRKLKFEDVYKLMRRKRKKQQQQQQKG